MIKKIVAKNLQRHEDLEIRLHPGLNVIRGANNVGKSTITRALKWLFSNRPLGNWMVRDAEGVEYAEFKIVTEDGIIHRIKGEKINDYVVNGETEGDVRTNVPDIIREFGMNPLEVNKQELWPNITTDSDRPFAVHESSVTKYGLLTILAESKVFAHVISEYSTERRRLNARIRELEEEKESIDVDLKGLEYIEYVADKVGKTAQIFTDLEKRVKKIEQVVSVLHDLYFVGKKLKETSFCLDNIDIVAIKRTLGDSTTILEKLQAVTSVTAELNKVKRSIEKIGVTEIDLANVEAKIEEITALKEAIAKCKEMVVLQAQIVICDTDLNGLQKQLDKFDFCPYCGK